MATLTIPYSFTAGNSAIAADVNSNFTAIKNFIDTYTVQTDGAVLATTSSYTAGSVTSNIIANDTIVNADINSAAGIVDTKLATIATALKVANSATTATSANTASAIVARDASGNFAAGTVTAALTGTASGNLVSGGALGTPSSGTLTNCTFPTLNQNTTGSAGSVPYSGLTGTVTTWNQNTTGSAASLSIMNSGSLVLTSDAVNTAWFYHGASSTPSTVIVQNGDFLAYGGVISIRYWNSSIVSVYVSGASFSTCRVNWITII